MQIVNIDKAIQVRKNNSNGALPKLFYHDLKRMCERKNISPYGLRNRKGYERKAANAVIRELWRMYHPYKKTAIKEALGVSWDRFNKAIAK